VLEHFRGPFLPEEAETPWLLAGREAVSSAVRSALMIADMLLAGSDDSLLLPALERAFAADPTSEDLARALMRALGRAGQHAEVLRVYRRLREMLSIVLGVAPSAQTQELNAILKSGAQAGGASDRAPLSRPSTRP
jgi:LuxR family maltose regulon positive regulatory protein